MRRLPLSILPPTPEEAFILIVGVHADRSSVEHVRRSFDRYRSDFDFRDG